MIETFLDANFSSPSSPSFSSGERIASENESEVTEKVEVTEKEKEKGRFGVGGEYKPQAGDVRTVMFFLFFVQVAFFGVGKYVFKSPFYLFFL